MLPGHALGATGAGDVKFMAAVGAIVGPVIVLKRVSLHGASPAACSRSLVAVRRRRLAATLAGTGRLIAAPGDAPQEDSVGDGVGSRFAYGPAIAIGSVLAALMRMRRGRVSGHGRAASRHAEQASRGQAVNDMAG